jgi:hypothetical protein
MGKVSARSPHSSKRRKQRVQNRRARLHGDVLGRQSKTPERAGYR